jgi:hypothetical protein
MPVDLFATLKKKGEDLHPQFRLLRDLDEYAPARNMLHELQAAFEDVDGNLVEQFQTTGFDSRAFELYLFELFRERGFVIDRSHSSPDFLVARDGLTAAVEAVTANPSTAEPYNTFKGEGGVEIDPLEYARHEAAVKLGSPLYSKLKKKYWELPHVTGKPLILAIQDFNSNGSLLQTSAALVQYLYGSEQRWYHDAQGQLVTSEHPISFHLKRNLTPIPSGFFNQPGAENVSGVLFSNSGTIAKFLRMGQQALGPARILKMLRFGLAQDFDPNSTLPEIFIHEVGKPGSPVETWHEGTALMLNPNAKHPVPQHWLGAAVELRWEGETIVSIATDRFLPLSSLTVTLPVGTSRAQMRAEIERQRGLLRDILKKLEPTLQHVGRRPL